jgi:zinc and cadmium transporter
VILRLVVWSLATTAANLLGLYLVRLRPETTRRHVVPVIAFGGGVVVGAALFHLLPEAAEHRADAGLFAGLAFLALYLFESHIPHEHATAHSGPANAHARARTVAMVSALAFAFHSITDGIALAVTVRDAPAISTATGIAILAHEAPEGIAVFTLLLWAGHSVRQSTAYAWFVALVTPVVAIATFGFVDDLPPPIVGALLGMVAGSFLYVGATDLLPEIKHRAGVKTSIAVVIGLAVALALRAVH